MIANVIVGMDLSTSGVIHSNGKFFFIDIMSVVLLVLAGTRSVGCYVKELGRASSSSSCIQLCLFGLLVWWRTEQTVTSSEVTSSETMFIWRL